MFEGILLCKYITTQIHRVKISWILKWRRKLVKHNRNYDVIVVSIDPFISVFVKGRGFKLIQRELWFELSKLMENVHWYSAIHCNWMNAIFYSHNRFLVLQDCGIKDDWHFFIILMLWSILATRPVAMVLKVTFIFFAILKVEFKVVRPIIFFFFLLLNFVNYDPIYHVNFSFWK
jgi:hypothetical protein